MRSMCLSLLAERPHAFKQFWGGTFCEGIITPPLLTLNMRGTASRKSVVKVNKQIGLFQWTSPEIVVPTIQWWGYRAPCEWTFGLWWYVSGYPRALEENLCWFNEDGVFL